MNKIVNTKFLIVLIEESMLLIYNLIVSKTEKVNQCYLSPYMKQGWLCPVAARG